MSADSDDPLLAGFTDLGQMTPSLQPLMQPMQLYTCTAKPITDQAEARARRMERKAIRQVGTAAWQVACVPGSRNGYRMVIGASIGRLPGWLVNDWDLLQSSTAYDQDCSYTGVFCSYVFCSYVFCSSPAPACCISFYRPSKLIEHAHWLHNLLLLSTLAVCNVKQNSASCRVLLLVILTENHTCQRVGRSIMIYAMLYLQQRPV